MGKHQIIIVGSGIAGMITAWQLHQFGFNVTICTQTEVSKHGLQSFHNSIKETLEFLKLGHISKKLLSTPSTPTIIWGKEKLDSNHKEKSYLVDRKEFDQLLLNHLKSVGIIITEEAKGFKIIYSKNNYYSVTNKKNNQTIKADFIVNASGKHVGSYNNFTDNGIKTLAIRFTWVIDDFKDCPNLTFVESANYYWCWGACLNNCFNLVVFIDPKSLSEHYEGKTSRLLKFVIKQHAWLRKWPTEYPCKE